MKGERIADGEVPTKPGQYSKHIVEAEGVACVVWLLVTPNGGHAGFIGPKPVGAGHEVDEHEDGTISVQPKPSNSNSILFYGTPAHPEKAWHGYIDHGEFTPC